MPFEMLAFVQDRPYKLGHEPADPAPRMPPTSTRSRQTQQIAALRPVKTPTTYLVAGFLLAACESADHTPNPSLVPAEAFDAMMWNHLTNGVPDVIRLDAGTCL